MPAAENSAPVSPIESGKASPFRLRNPVFDPRVASPLVTPVQEQLPPFPPPNNGEFAEPAKAAPFKMRHVVTDPKFAHSRATTPDITRSTGSTPSPQQPPSATHAETVAARAMTSVDRLPNIELPPNSNVVMPTVVARRPFAVLPSAPPPPPPKDEKRREPKLSVDHKASRPSTPVRDAPVVKDLTLGKGGDGKWSDLECVLPAQNGHLERVNV